MSNTTKYDLGIFIFRKDFRIEDNRGLNKLNSICKEILPIFIFDPEQIDMTVKTSNYLSLPALRFICESIQDLASIIKSKSSKLYIFYGKPKNVVQFVISHLIDKDKDKDKYQNICLGLNQDFTKYSLERDKLIEEICKKNQIDYLFNTDDFTLCSMELLVKSDKTAYKQYGAFRKNMLTHKKNFNPVEKHKINWIKKNINIKKSLNPEDIDIFWSEHSNKFDKNYKPAEVGSRSLALKILSDLKDFKDYNEDRDILSYQTTHLSAYLNFGLVSEREFYYGLVDKLGNSTQLINQVIWRDYYYCLLRFLPGANSYDKHIDPRYEKIKWVNSNKPSKTFKTSKEWKEWELMMGSKTGFLIVDAAIQELLHTGFMHNRCRMIVGVFSVKYLGINPLCRYIGLNDWFSRHLLDCSTSQNKLNCQWVTELDFPGKKFAPSKAPIAGRPMSVTNVMIKKWDQSCLYIKKWLPNLKDVDNKILYNWDTKYLDSIHPGPIFDPRDRYNQWIKSCTI